MGPYVSYLVETFITLLAVCTLALVVLYSARKLGVGRARGPVALMGQLPLDARRQIYLVRVGAQVLVVGVSEAGFTKLGEVPAADLEAVEDGSVAMGATSFNDVLSRVLKRKPPQSPDDHEARP
ncbi:MAG: flagellar biosynthetic protein FliO [Polyangiaceae bacterium]|nr:flagellar biosynthetic protein FliO [Polyangiaceae bacterium]